MNIKPQQSKYVQTTIQTCPDDPQTTVQITIQTTLQTIVQMTLQMIIQMTLHMTVQTIGKRRLKKAIRKKQSEKSD